jgi:hypothetical protein
MTDVIDFAKERMKRCPDDYLDVPGGFDVTAFDGGNIQFAIMFGDRPIILLTEQDAVRLARKILELDNQVTQ